MQVEFSFHLLIFARKSFLMTLKTSVLHPILFIVLVFKGMLKTFIF